MDQYELAWAAGFFDGEGHVRKKKGKYVTLGRLQVSQKTTECLERLSKAVGNVGTIGGPYHSKNPVYFWSLSDTSEVDRVLTSLWPYLSGPKREQALKSGFVLGVIRKPRIGRPPRDNRTIPKCHPTRKHIGNGLCGSCYQRAWVKQKYGK